MLVTEGIRRQRFELAIGAPQVLGQPNEIGEAPLPAYVSDFLASSDGLALAKAFTRIKEPELRRRIVRLVEEIALDSEEGCGHLLRPRGR